VTGSDNGGVLDRHDRTRALVATGIALTSELSLDAVLQRVVETAAELTGARYAALGVIDRTGRQLERFLTHGIDPETHRQIGDLPRGRGILGALITDARPLRLTRIADDPRSVGFPPGHPPMHSFLGVPIVLRGVAYGNLYLTEKEGGDEFTEEDEELVQLLASQAAVAIENARLYESATRWSAQLESLNEVGDALVSEIDLQRLHALVAGRLRELLDCRLVAIGLPEGADGIVRWATADGEGAAEIVDTVALASNSKSGRILERRRSERIDSVLDDPEVNLEMARALQMNAALWVPLLLRDRAIGVLLAVDKRGADPRFSNDDLRLAEAFAVRASVAVDLSQRVARDAMRRVVSGQELERRRLARELHDETGQALTSILLGLRSVEEADGDEGRALAIAELRELVTTTLHDVRRLAVELRPKALDDFGLEPALERLVSGFGESTGIAVELETTLDERLPAEIETALYRIVQEALTNIVKHAHARRVSIVVMRRGNAIATLIEDDGRGFAPTEDSDGLGVVGMRERVSLLDGTLQIESGAAGGTTIAVEVPLP
jgi:signal transduction histidine kinase